jgi:V8-like Glu-specific endopeptidase
MQSKLRKAVVLGTPVVAVLVAIGEAPGTTHSRDEISIHRSGRIVDVPASDGLASGPRTIAGGATQRVCVSNAEFMRLRLTASGGTGTVTMKAATKDESQTVDAAGLSPASWSRRFHDRCVDVTAPSGAGKVTVDKLLVPLTNTATPKSYFPENLPPDYKDPLTSGPVDIRSTVRNGAKLLALLAFMRDEGEFDCTAWFLSKRLLITNIHCVDSEARARSLSIEVGVFDGAETPTDSLFGASYLLGSDALDYAILKLDRDTTIPVTPLKWRKGKPGSSEGIAIVHHPGGLPARGSWDNECRVRQDLVAGRGGTPVDFGHRCDTEGGSSGGIVLSRNAACAHVIGLHHWGVEEKPYTANSQNQAVRSQSIVDDLTQRAAGAGPESQKAKEVLAAIGELRACP